MLERFKDSYGRQRLAEAFCEQELVQHSEACAHKLAELASLETVEKGQQIYVEGAHGKGVLFFLLSGSVELSVQGHRVAALKPGQCFGEFPILDRRLPYRVTAAAGERSTIAMILEERFQSIASEYPSLWRNMARMLAHRLIDANDAKLKVGSTDTEDLKALRIGHLLKRLTIAQLWAVTLAILGAFSAVATIAYNIGNRVP